MEAAQQLFDRLKKATGQSLNDELDAIAGEDYFVDFKLSKPDKKNPKRLNDPDRQNLAKAISGFGNSEGGVLVWGIADKSKVDGSSKAGKIEGIEQPEAFTALLSNAIATCTVPAHQTVTNAIVGPDKDGKRFVVTLVPTSSLLPHQTVEFKQYFIRAGSCFEPTPHGVLAGMFGRGIPPSVEFTTWVSRVYADGAKIGVTMAIGVANTGSTIIDGLYYSYVATELPSGEVKVRYSDADLEHWTIFNVNTENIGSGISAIGYRIPPSTVHHVAEFMFYVEPLGDIQDLALEFTTGCDGTPPQLWTCRIPASILMDVGLALVQRRVSKDEAKDMLNQQVQRKG